MIIDRLIEAIRVKGNPTCVGLDTVPEFLPEETLAKVGSVMDAAKAITEFNCAIIDKIKDVVPAVKVQAACYEMLGMHGMIAFYDTLKYAKKNGLFVISDVKRGDIGSTAGYYAKAYLGGMEIAGLPYVGFDSDFITVNGYLGSDGIKPFVSVCESNDKGMFMLVKTSNPSSEEFQDKKYEDGDTLYEKMAAYAAEAGSTLVGEYGYSSLGIVVGATKPAQANNLREKFPSLFFLIPGYGAQGATAADLKGCFDSKGDGGIVNSSRGILLAYRNQKYEGLSFADAALAAVVDMREDLVGKE